MNPSARMLILISAIALLAHRAEPFAKEVIAFPSLVTAHVTSALYLDWWRIDPNLSYVESCWAGSGHSP